MFRTLELKIPPIILPILAILGMYLTREIFPHFGFPQVMANLFAGFVLFTAMTFAVMGVYVFKKHQTTVHPMHPEDTSKIVQNNVFAISRNPMYLSFVMSIIACGLYLQHTGFILFALGAMTYLHCFQILPEERILLDKFGEEYAQYQSKVARWF
ncbi:MAG: hypothetical protein GJ671_07770 [Alteromonadaceae bacterium]|nr:hypothetical protein [Alteromonadaceae bacterium]